jgi:hypothetical protein
LLKEGAEALSDLAKAADNAADAAVDVLKQAAKAREAVEAAARAAEQRLKDVDQLVEKMRGSGRYKGIADATLRKKIEDIFDTFDQVTHSAAGKTYYRKGSTIVVINSHGPNTMFDPANRRGRDGVTQAIRYIRAHVLDEGGEVFPDVPK